MCNIITTYQEKILSKIDTLVEEIYNIICNVVKNPVIVFRIKNLETLRKKMMLKNVTNIFLIDDVYGIRIITSSIDEVYSVLEKISQNFPGFIDHDYIKEPKMCISDQNKGKMLRMLQFIAYKNNVPFEIQITTSIFNVMNESIHEGYKKYNPSATKPII